MPVTRSQAKPKVETSTASPKLRTNAKKLGRPVNTVKKTKPAESTVTSSRTPAAQTVTSKPISVVSKATSKVRTRKDALKATTNVLTAKTGTDTYKSSNVPTKDLVTSSSSKVPTITLKSRKGDPVKVPNKVPSKVTEEVMIPKVCLWRVASTQPTAGTAKPSQLTGYTATSSRSAADLLVSSQAKSINVKSSKLNAASSECGMPKPKSAKPVEATIANPAKAIVISSESAVQKSKPKTTRKMKLSNALAECGTSVQQSSSDRKRTKRNFRKLSKKFGVNSHWLSRANEVTKQFLKVQKETQENVNQLYQDVARNARTYNNPIDAWKQTPIMKELRGRMRSRLLETEVPNVPPLTKSTRLQLKLPAMKRLRSPDTDSDSPLRLKPAIPAVFNFAKKPIKHQNKKQKNVATDTHEVESASETQQHKQELDTKVVLSVNYIPSVIGEEKEDVFNETYSIKKQLIEVVDEPVEEVNSTDLAPVILDLENAETQNEPCDIPSNSGTPEPVSHPTNQGILDWRKEKEKVETYDITLLSEFDEVGMMHRENKVIPEWAKNSEQLARLLYIYGPKVMDETISSRIFPGTTQYYKLFPGAVHGHNKNK